MPHAYTENGKWVVEHAGTREVFDSAFRATTYILTL
jgi:hypothetical protein